MGAKPSKPAFSTATVNLAEAQSVAASAASSAASGAWGTARTIMYVLLGLVVVGVIGATLYFIFAIKPLENSLTITKATFGSNDYTQLMQGNVQKDALYLSKGFLELQGATGLTTDTGTITYTFMDQPNTVLTATINKLDEPIDISAANRDSKENFTNKRKPSSSTPNKTGPSLLGRLKNAFNYSGSSADLLPYPKVKVPMVCNFGCISKIGIIILVKINLLFQEMIQQIQILIILKFRYNPQIIL